MSATGPMLSLTQIRAWDTGHLNAVATRWISTARMWEDAFTHVSTEISNPGGTPWDGVAAEAAQSRAYWDRLKVARLADQLVDAADVAHRGADQIAYAKR